MTGFPDLSAEEVHAATAERWDIRSGVPLPRGDWLRCPICGAAPQIRWWKWHVRPPGHTIRYRCDVSAKCTSCAALWMHGVVLTEDDWAARPYPKLDRALVKWREIRDVLEG